VTWLTNNEVADGSVALAHLILAATRAYIHTYIHTHIIPLRLGLSTPKSIKYSLSWEANTFSPIQ
jgi:hypothetical protein